MISKKDLKIVPLFGFDLCGSSKGEVLALVRRNQVEKEKLFIATPNPEFIVFAGRNRWFKKTLLSADILIPDGIGLVWASRLLSAKAESLKKTIPGVDFTLDLLSLAAKQDLSVYFFGATPGVADKALVEMKQKYPGLKGWVNSGPVLRLDGNGHWQGKSRRALTAVVKDINEKKPDFLFVALGMGKLEKFIADYLPRLKTKVAIGVGGTFDYLSFKTQRAPLWLRNLGLEWLYRLVKEPWRLGRQTRLITFLWLVLTTWIKKTFKSV